MIHSSSSERDQQPKAAFIQAKLKQVGRSRSEPNSRVRDLVDLVLLARSNLDVGLLGVAIRATFDRRGTHPLPAELPPPVESWKDPFDALAGQCNLTADLGRAFAEVSQLFSRIGQGR